MINFERRNIKILILSIIFLLGLLNSVHAQVNIETLRKSKLMEGLYLDLSTKFGLLAGNSENKTISGNFRTDYLFDDYHLFSIANGARGETDDEVYQKRAFLHLRGIKNISSFYGIEAFGQEEFNDFLLLDERNLLGGGLRFTVISTPKQQDSPTDLTLYVGIGAMMENERFSDETGEPNTQILRSTNYISAKWNIKEWLLFSATCYYQVDTTCANDYRIITNGSFGVNITEALLFTLNVDYRYDNDPPENLKRYDLEITNGITYLFP